MLNRCSPSRGTGASRGQQEAPEAANDHSNLLASSRTGTRIGGYRKRSAGGTAFAAGANGEAVWTCIHKCHATRIEAHLSQASGRGDVVDQAAHRVHLAAVLLFLQIGEMHMFPISIEQ